MVLIIAHHYDQEAQWLYQRLQKEAKIASVLLVPEALGIDYNITLNLRNNGRHHAFISFYEANVTLHSADVLYVINRLSFINPLAWNYSSPVEKTYAIAEMNAFFSAFIHSLPCPSTNRIHHGALYGEGFTLDQWATYLQGHNVSIHPVFFHPENASLTDFDPENTVRFLQANEELLSPPLQQPIKEFEKLKRILYHYPNNEMREFLFTRKDDGLALLQITKTPALSLYGEGFLHLLYQQLNTTQHDTVNGRTQRTAVAIAG